VDVTGAAASVPSSAAGQADPVAMWTRVGVGVALAVVVLGPPVTSLGTNDVAGLIRDVVVLLAWAVLSWFTTRRSLSAAVDRIAFWHVALIIVDAALTASVIVDRGFEVDSLLLVVPMLLVMEGAYRFGLAGASITWSVVAFATVVAMTLDLDSSAPQYDLGGVLGPLSAVLIVGIILGWHVERVANEPDAPTSSPRVPASPGDGLLSTLFRSLAELPRDDEEQILAAAAAILGSIGFDKVELHELELWTDRWTARSVQPSIGEQRDLHRLMAVAGESVVVRSTFSADTEVGVTPVEGMTTLVVAPIRWMQSKRCVVLAWTSTPIDDRDERVVGLGALARQLELALGHAALTRSHDQLQRVLDHDARHDSLTGVANRIGLGIELERNLAIIPWTTNVVVCELDEFQRVNDEHGWAVGDSVLIEVGRRLMDVAGARGLVARSGGARFVVVTTAAEANADVSERVHAALADPIVIDGATVAVSVTVGQAAPNPHGDSVAELLRRAERAAQMARHRRARDARSDNEAVRA
jgi:diguanylate cyclase (GGDEF)-like protein